MKFNNPAIRLHSILLELSQANQNLATSVVLASAFGVIDQPKELMRAIVEFHNLVQEVKDYAQTTSLPVAPLTRYIPQIDSAVAFTNFDAAWGNYKSRITVECLVIVEMIAYVDNVLQDEDIGTEDLKYLDSALTELFEEVESNKEISKEFRVFVLKNIESIRRAISEYRISGASGFSRYLEALLIDVVKDKEILKKAEASNSSTFIKFKKIIKNVVKFADCTSDGLKALEKIKESFDGGMLLLSDIGSNATTGSDIPELATPNVTTMV